MSPLSIAVLVGSLREESINRAVAHALVKLAPESLAFTFVDIGSLPLYNEDDDDAVAPPAAVAAFRDSIRSAGGLLFVTPEYNRSIPGVLKNALDQGSRPYGQSVWAGKPAGIMGVSHGGPGTSMAQQHLRNVLSFLNVPTLSQPEMFIQWRDGLVVDGEIGPDAREHFQAYMDAFVAWVERFTD